MAERDPRYFKVYQDGDDRELEQKIQQIVESGAAPGIDMQARESIEEIQRKIDSGEIGGGDGGGGAGVDSKAREDIQKVNVKLAEIGTDPTFKADTSLSSAQLGAELVNGTGWTVPAGWTGTFATGFKNTVGNTNVLSRTMGSTGTKLYQVNFRIESPTPAGIPNPSTDFSVTLGNSEPFITYNGGGTKDYTFGIQSVSDGDLKFIPGPTFDGTVKNVSVKEIVGNVSPVLSVEDKSGNNVLEMRTGETNLLNKFIGKDSGKSNTSGRENAGFGDMSLSKNTTGYWNAALGKEALRDNTTGSRNVAAGYLALSENISGDRNIAIGTFTLQRNTHGRQNIALGADCLWVNTTGSRNVALGMGTMGSSTTGNENVAIGYAVMEANTKGNNNIALGYNSLYDNKEGNTNIAIGRESLKKNIASNNIGIGTGSGSWNTTGISNVSIGHGSLSRSKTGSENTVMGHYAAASGAYGDGISQSTIVGAWAGNSLTTGGNNNTLIGYNAGRGLTTGAGNIIIGRNAGVSYTTESNVLNIGNLLYGKLNSTIRQIGIGIEAPTAAMHLLGSPNGGAGSASLKLGAGTLLSVKEPGAIEFDGTNLYFTDSAGNRKQLAVVA